VEGLLHPGFMTAAIETSWTCVQSVAPSVNKVAVLNRTSLGDLAHYLPR
jgi:hypothetical protein